MAKIKQDARVIFDDQNKTTPLRLYQFPDNTYLLSRWNVGACELSKSELKSVMRAFNEDRVKQFKVKT